MGSLDCLSAVELGQLSISEGSAQERLDLDNTSVGLKKLRATTSARTSKFLCLGSPFSGLLLSIPLLRLPYVCMYVCMYVCFFQICLSLSISIPPSPSFPVLGMEKTDQSNSRGISQFFREKFAFLGLFSLSSSTPDCLLCCASLASPASQQVAEVAGFLLSRRSPSQSLDAKHCYLIVGVAVVSLNLSWLSPFELDAPPNLLMILVPH